MWMLGGEAVINRENRNPSLLDLVPQIVGEQLGIALDGATAVGVENCLGCVGCGLLPVSDDSPRFAIKRFERVILGCDIRRFWEILETGPIQVRDTSATSLDIVHRGSWCCSPGSQNWLGGFSKCGIVGKWHYRGVLEYTAEVVVEVSG